MLPGWRELLHHWDAWLLTIVLAGFFPFVGVRRFRMLETRPDPTPTGIKLRLYASTMLSEWLLVALMLFVAARHGLSPAEVGERIGDAKTILIVTVALLAALAALTAFNLTQVRRARVEDLRAALRRARKFVPVGRVETSAFAAVAVTAGVCEELLYRGWLVSFLGAAFGSAWAGVIVAGVVFGFGHAYQGPRGIVTTGILGLGFGALFLWVRSLLPGQVIHAGLDLVNGVLAGRIAKRIDAETHVSETSLGGSAPPA